MPRVDSGTAQAYAVRMFGWLFGPKAARPPTPEVEERLEKVERGLRALSDDWGEFHEKVQRAVWRAAKRKDPVGPVEDDPIPPEQPARYQLGGTPRAVGSDPLSEAIRRRRGFRVTRDPARDYGEN